VRVEAVLAQPLGECVALKVARHVAYSVIRQAIAPDDLALGLLVGGASTSTASRHRGRGATSRVVPGASSTICSTASASARARAASYTNCAAARSPCIRGRTGRSRDG